VTLLLSADIGIAKAEEQEKIIEALKNHTMLKKGTLSFGYGVGNIDVFKC